MILNRVDLNEGRATGWRVQQTRPLGHHLILNAKGTVVSRFVSQLDPSNSDLRLLSAVVSDEDQTQMSKGQNAQSAALQMGARRELWHGGLIGLFLLLFGEGVLLHQRRRQEVT